MIPTSLYIHTPWCIKKCPYCDFNSHKKPDELPESAYIKALLADLHEELAARPQSAPLTSLFIGGGTPSLLSEHAYETLLNGIQKCMRLSSHLEITLEANPGAVDFARFKSYRQLGINRLSIGIQSFNPIHLKTLGRVHTDAEAHKAIETARAAGFDNLNLDLMHGLPNQTIEEGLLDLRTGLAFAPEHLSWYQLTIEPNTVFYKLKPELPAEDDAFLLEQRGFEHLAKNNYQRYEISAFSIPHRQAEHNMNYWLFGDYYGIGAGAHGKWTSPETGVIYRTTKHRQPNDYLNPDKPYLAKLVTLTPNDCILEYMLNTTRLEQSISLMHFTERTHLPLPSLLPGLQTAQQKGLVEITDTHWRVTPHGRRFTNDLQAIFL